ncbi:hypothetical protein CV016_14900 [Yersinia kristensenii]|uniref:DUF2970 domain-containing protein n=1 Tax=Yersinia kristensenii TaxID=28152 RepID=A0AB73PNI1_YERKR|nr:hypothetical protein CBW52_07900 [Yersinia kristensenii]PHZ37051.1 hypothetical protein CS536_05340 [Yersinia kristensenii]PJE82909.1 hypothetical protein CU276_15360 [Yersinia kristensenii]PJG61930.1 hypothetical protein CV016_14900 [Yersinia kristensenii]
MIFDNIMPNKTRFFLCRVTAGMFSPVGIALKKQQNTTQNRDYSTGIGDAQFALVVLLTTSCLLIAITLIVILWLI